MPGESQPNRAISEALYRYCRAMDRIDPALAATVWHADATLDYGDMFVGSAADFTANVEAMHAPFARTHHQLGNILIEAAEDRAVSESYITARLWSVTDGSLSELMVVGRYCDRWSLRAGRWAIDHRQFLLDMMYRWSPPLGSGGGAPWASAEEFLAIAKVGRGRADPSYQLGATPISGGFQSFTKTS